MPEVGDFVELRGRRWLVNAGDSDLLAIGLSCISDDAQGETLEVLWDAEISPQSLDESGWVQIGRGAPDTPEVLAAHIRAVRWNSASAADRDLIQAPFRAGIRLDPYQLLPLAKGLRLPRVNLLIADGGARRTQQQRRSQGRSAQRSMHCQRFTRSGNGSRNDCAPVSLRDARTSPTSFSTT